MTTTATVSSTRLDTASIDAVLQRGVDSGAVPNVVAMAADDSGVIYEGASGPRAVGEAEPVTADTMFRIASMTKMVATVAALQQSERGALDLKAPIATYLPEFADLQVLDGFDGDTPRLRPPASQATVEQLITHTSGLSYWFFNADVVRWEQVTGTPNVLAGTMDVFTAPLVADPGTRYEYGINTDWLGRVVEVASGESFDSYVTDNILTPLRMADSTFLMTADQRSRSVPVHVRGDEGWTPTEIDLSQTPQWWSGGHGLYATPRDYLRFQQMLLGGGTFEGATVLERATVEQAFRNQIGDLDFPAFIETGDPMSTCSFEAGPGHKWGHGLLLNTVQQPGMRAPGSGAWAGIFNTHYWVDPTTRVTGAIYTQFLPFVTPESMQLYADFERALYAALPR